MGVWMRPKSSLNIPLFFQKGHKMMLGFLSEKLSIPNKHLNYYPESFDYKSNKRVKRAYF